MKTNLKRFVSLLLVAVMLVSGFSGFGTLTVHAQHFTLKDYGHEYLYIGQTKTLALDLTGRTGSAGAMTWTVTCLDYDTVLPASTYTLSTSPEAAALGTADDILTLDGTAVAAALGVTEETLTSPLSLEVLLEEANNTSCTTWLNLQPAVQKSARLVSWLPEGTSLLGFSTLLSDNVLVEYYDDDAPYGYVVTQPIVDVYGNNDNFTITYDAYDTWSQYVLTPMSTGETVFTAVLGDSELGNRPLEEVTFTLSATDAIYTLSHEYDDRTIHILQNDSISFDVRVIRTTSGTTVSGEAVEVQEDISAAVSNLSVTAVSTRQDIITTSVNGNRVTLNSSLIDDDSAEIYLSATGTYNGQSFEASYPMFYLWTSSQYTSIETNGLNPNVAVGDTVDLSALTCTLHSYVAGGPNTHTTVTDPVSWTVYYDNTIWEAQDNSDLPVMKRISDASGAFHLYADYNGLVADQTIYFDPAPSSVGAHFTLIQEDNHDYLHKDTTKTLQLDLRGRGGTVGAISWWLTDTEGNLLNGDLFTVSTSADAQALNASGDVITLDGAAVAAALNVTEPIGVDGVTFVVHCKEDGNMELEGNYWLVDDYWEPVSGYPIPERTDYLLGYNHDAGNDSLYGHFEVWHRDAEHPQGTYLRATVTGLSVVDGSSVSFERSSDTDWRFMANDVGSTTFRATYEDAEGRTGSFDFTLNGVTQMYVLRPNFPYGNQCILKNDSLTLDTHVESYTAYTEPDGSVWYDIRIVDDYIVDAYAEDPSLVSVSTDGTNVTLSTSEQDGGTLVRFTAQGTDNGQPFTAVSERHWIDLMDHYTQVEFDGFDPSIAVGDTIDLADHFRNIEYTYVPGGSNTVVDRTADTVWTVWDDNGVFAAVTSDPLPVLERVGSDPSVLNVRAELDCGDYGISETTQGFGVDAPHGYEQDRLLNLWWEQPEKYLFFDTETASYPLTVNCSGVDADDVEIVVECGGWNDEGDFLGWGNDAVSFDPETGVCTVDCSVLLDAADAYYGSHWDECSFTLLATAYVDGEFCHQNSTWGALRRTRVYLEFPQDQVDMKLNGSMNDYYLESEFYYEIHSAEYGENDFGSGFLTVTDMELSNVNGTADVTLEYNEDAQAWFLSLGAFFEGSYDITLHYTDPLTGGPATHTYTCSRVPEIWYMDIICDYRQLLPGESRTITTMVERWVYDAENGSVPGDTSEATVNWIGAEFPGVTYTPDGGSLTVDTTLETGVYNKLSITAELMVDGEPMLANSINLHTREDYYTLSSDGTPHLELGETVDFTPEVQYHWLDENGGINVRTLNAEDDSDCFWTVAWDGSTPVSVGGEAIPSGTESGPWPLGTTFTCTRDSLRYGGLYFELSSSDTENIFSFSTEYAHLWPNAWFNCGSYELAVGETLDLAAELNVWPENVLDYLENTYWNYSNGVIEIDENGLVTATAPGETIVWFGDGSTGDLAECQIFVYDPNGSGGFGGDVFFNDPAFRHIYENQTLVLPLDTTLIHGDEELQLELEIGYWTESLDEFISFGDGILTPVYGDPEDPTLVTGVSVNGEALHAAADAAIPYNWDVHGCVVFARAVYEDGSVHSKASMDIDMRKTRVEYGFEEDLTLLADNYENILFFDNTYNMWVYFGHDNYEHNEPYANGVEESGRFWIQRYEVLESSTHTVTDGTVEGLTFVANTEADGYELTIPAGFVGDIEITQLYTGRFAQGGSTPYTFVVHVVPEFWNLRMELEGSEWSLLPGEERTFNAVYEHLVYDPEQGQILGSTDGVSVQWRYDPMRDVTYEADGDSLTVRTGPNADYRDITVGASLMRGDEELIGIFDMLWVTNNYYTIVTDTLDPDMALGASKTFTPELHHYWLDESDRTIQHELLAANNGWELEWLVQGDAAGLTVDGEPVAQGDRFPLGTAFTYTRSFTGYTSFAIEAVRPGEDYQPAAGRGYDLNAVNAELNTKKMLYVLNVGDTLDLMDELVYSPANLLDYLGELTWTEDGDSGCITIDAAGNVTAVSNGAAGALLQSDEYGHLLNVTIVVADLSGEIKDPTPEQDVTTPVDDVTVVESADTQTALKDELIDLITLLDGSEEDVESVFDGDIDQLVDHVLAGSPLRSELVITPLDENDPIEVPGEDRERMEESVTEALGSGAEIRFFDTSIQILANGEHIGNKTSTSELMEIRILMPNDLRSDGFRYTVFRLHDGIVEALDTILNEDWTISFFTDKFSTYALGGSYDCETLGHSFTNYVYNNDAGIGVDGTETALCDHGCGTPDTRTAAGTARPEPSVDGAERIYGNSRYETSFGIANEYKSVLGVEKFGSIIVASGENFPDALAGSYLAAVKNAPIIMAKVKGGVLQNADKLKEYIEANLADGGTVYVLGGNTAIPYTLETELAGLPLTRLEGNSRYETNIEILNEAGITGDTLLVCTGKGYADALSASATGLPILLVDGEGSLKASQREFLEQHNFSNIYILGGPVAVNESYDAALAELGGTVTRLAGASRRATSVLVAETFFTNPTAAVIAYSDNFPDGLCGGPLANALGAPVLLTKTAIPTEAITYAQQNGIVAGYVLGGSALISDDVTCAILGTSSVR